MTYNIFPPRTTGHTVTGQYLARNSLNARDRARLAADIIAGRVQVASGSLTIGQIRTLCRVNQLYLNEARSTDMRRARRSRLARAFNKIDADGRAELCRTIGVAKVWDALSAAVE